MSSYLPSSELTDLLPSSHGLSAGQLTSCITIGSEMVDSALAHLYWTPFTDYAASPAATPPYVVRRAAAFYAAAEAFALMNELNLGRASATDTDYRKRAMELLLPYIDTATTSTGPLVLPPETLTELLTASDWGDGDPYDTYQAPLSCSNCEVIVESPRFSGTDWQLYEDFHVLWHAGTRKWIIERFDSTIGDGAGTEGDPGNTLTYEVTRIRKREAYQAGIRSADLERA